MKFTCRKTLIAALALALASLSLAQAQDPTIAKIIDEGKNRSEIMKTLSFLSLKIGPRVTGSPELKRAQDWAIGQFKKSGCDTAVLDQWGEVPVGFHKGPNMVGRMVTPFVADFQFSSANWTEGTRGPVRGKAIPEPKTLEEIAKLKKQLKGAWVLMTTQPGMRMPNPPTEGDALKLWQALYAAKIAGRVYGSKNELVHAHGSFRDKTFEKRPQGVAVEIRASDMDRIKRNLEKGAVELEFGLDHRWIKGPIPQYNVVADIRGTEKPDEMIIICGHLDSWNPVGSQGTMDNGTGSSVAIEAARILGAVGAKPKRTIRFILWSGEEQGLLGSTAYVEKYKDQMGKVSMVINDDGGTGYHGGYEISAEMKPMLSEAIAPVQAAFPDLPMTLNVREWSFQGGGSDHAPFLPHGVPAFHTEEGGDANYLYVWHTQNDRLENARPNYLVQSATEAAAVAYYLANAETLLPRAPMKPTAPSAPTRGGSFDDDHGH